MSRESVKFNDYLILTPTEGRILKHLVSEKSGASISEISDALSVSRTSIYNAVSSLMKKDIVSKNGFCYFLVNTKWRTHNLKESIPKEQIKTLMTEMLELKKGEIIYSIESDEEIKELFKSSKKELLVWQKTVAQKEIVLKGIGTKKALTILRPMLDVNLSDVVKKRSGSARFMNEAIKGHCTLVSFRSSVIFFSRTKKFFYRIDDQNISVFIQGIIDSLYDFLQYYPIVG